MIDYQYIRHYDYSGMRTAPLCIDGHTKGTLRMDVCAVGVGRGICLVLFCRVFCSDKTFFNSISLYHFLT